MGRGDRGLAPENGYKGRLYLALQRNGFKRARAARALGVSRETVRVRLIEAGGLEQLIRWAEEIGLAPKGAESALALVSAQAQRRAKRMQPAQAIGGDNQSATKHLRGPDDAPTLTGQMATPAAVDPSSTAKLYGETRAFVKRVAVELDLMTASADSISDAVDLMVRYCMRLGDPKTAAQLLLAELREKDDDE